MAIAHHAATVTVNAAFLQEIKEVHEELWDLLRQLREHCQNPERLVQRSRLTAQLSSQLMDHVALHFALEEAYGYFDDPLYVAPHLNDRAEALRQQHGPLYLEASELAELADQLAEAPSLREAVRFGEAFGRWDRQLAKHEEQEVSLILQAYGDDLGVGD